MRRTRTRRSGRGRSAITTRHLTIVAPDKGAEDCAALRAALLFYSLAGELGR